MTLMQTKINSGRAENQAHQGRVYPEIGGYSVAHAAEFGSVGVAVEPSREVVGWNAVCLNVVCRRARIHAVGQTQLADNGTDSLGGDHRVGVLFVQDQFADAGFDIRQDFGAVRISFVSYLDPYQVVFQKPVSFVFEDKSDAGDATLIVLFMAVGF